MSDKSSDSRPSSQPSALLLMATAEYGGLSDGTGHSILLPAPIRTAGSPQMLSADEDAEADSFIGQTPALDSHHHSTPFSMFQHSTATGHDPFSEVKQPQLEDFGSTRPRPTSVSPPSAGQQSTAATRSLMPAPPAPLPQFTQVPFAGQNVPPLSLSTAVPPAATSAPPNLFRMTGKPHYAAPPAETTSYHESHMHMQPGHPPKPGFPPVPPVVQSGALSAFPPLQPTTQQGAYHSMSSFLPRPFESGPVSASSTDFSTSTGDAPARDMEGGMRSYQIHPPVGLPAAGQTYLPIQPHWFHRMTIEGKQVWRSFSMADSKRLEEVFKQGASVGHLVSVQGGRYDVNIRQRLQTAIYWQEEASPVRRCSWFYRPDGENRFMPYEEEFAAELEESYKRTILTNDFHKRLIFPGGETIVIHNPQVIVQFSASAQPDAYGNTVSESRPRVVKRGVVENDELPEDESPQIDHLVLVVQGISVTCNLRYRNTIDCVSSFRSVASEMMKSHFKQAVDDRRAGRIEFLPVRWHDALHGHVAGLDRKLKSITLGSVGKLRNFANDHLLDTVVYRSPVYAQDIVLTVGNELNSLVQLFRSRNPAFTGGISLAGHSLGSQILFDILLNQPSSMTPDDGEKLEAGGGEHSAVPAPVAAASDVMPNGKSQFSEDARIGTETLDSVLTQLGLLSYIDILKKEQMDLNSLSLCEESDLKEMGFPLGPRKKLLGFLKNFQEQQARRKLEAEQRAQQMAVLKAQEEAKKAEQAAVLAAKDPLLSSSNNTSIEYVIGKTGVGSPFVKYPQLTFQPENFFALGSSVAMFLAMKGTDSLGEEFMLPTCPGYFNIFHPFDPLAYRMEPLILPAYPGKPVQIPHHKGRKRLHLELKESLTRIGYDLKQRIIDSVKNTWRSINSFALGHKNAATALQSDEVEREVDTVLSEMVRDADDSGSVVASSVADEDDIPIGSLNQGRRVDFVLQEKPIEIFNDYMFALGSYTCYWESEDTALMMLKEIYLLMGIVSKKPGAEVNQSQPTVTSFAPPPKTGFMHPPATSSRGPISNNPLLQGTSGGHLPSMPPMGLAPVGMHPPLVSSSVSGAAALQPSVARPLAPSPAPPPVYGPPPMSGFVKK